MKKLLIIGLLFTLPALTGCGKNTHEATAPQVKIDQTKLITVQKSVIDDYYETSGEVKAKTTSKVASKIMARVESVNFNEGDTVQKGQLLVILDNNDILAQTQSTEAAYNEAIKNRNISEENKKLSQITYQRYKNIYEEKALTKQELDEASAKRNIAELEAKRAAETVNRTKAYLNEARSVLSYSKIYAPISGIITEKNIDVGDTASPGQVLLVIKDISSLEIESDIDESYINNVKKGTPVKILIENHDNEFNAKISEVVSSIDTASRTFKIKIFTEKSNLNDGQYVKIAIPTGKREAIVIPKTAVVKKGQLEGVYTADATFRLIKTGKSVNNMVEVLSGLEAGDKILGE